MQKFKVAHAAASVVLLAAGLSVFSVFSSATPGHSPPGTGPGGGSGGGGGSGSGGTLVGGDDGSDSGTFGSSSGGGVSGTCANLQRVCMSGCTDFPTAPFIDSTPDDGSPATPADAATHFSGTAATSGGPCILDPVDGVVIPYNWVRPRFRIPA